MFIGQIGQADDGVENRPVDRMLIDGQAVGAQDGRVIDVENPANRRLIARVPRAGEADVDLAVAAAARAFEAWRSVPPRERGRLLLRIAEAVEAETEPIARMLSLETGNAIRTQARPEVGTRLTCSGITAGWRAN